MATPKRAYWKGYLRLSLVSIGVEVFSATRTSKLNLHQVHKPSGKRIRYQKIAPEVGPVRTEDIVKGLELEDDRYVLLDQDELDAIKLESKRTIDLVQFIDYDDIDPRFYEKPYYVTPDGEQSDEGFLVIHRALKESRKVGLGQMVLRGKENLVAVKPCGKGLLMETLRYADEVRESDSYFDDIPKMKLEDEMVDLAKELIARKSAKFDPAAFTDRYAAALRELVEEKRKGKQVVEIESEGQQRSGQVVDLMEALKKSLKNGKGGRSQPSSGRKGSRATRRKAS